MTSLAGKAGKRSNRLVMLLISIAVVFVLIIIRLGYIQLYKGEEYRKRASSQWVNDRVIPAMRGSILDRNGRVLAQSAATHTIVVEPKRIFGDNVSRNAPLLAEVLGLDPAEVTAKFLDASKTQHVLARQVRLEESDKVRALKIDGVYLFDDRTRAYPMKSMASRLVGFTDVSGQGQTGIEYSFDAVLRGVDGQAITQVDMQNREVPTIEGDNMYTPPEDGRSVALTIDSVLQASVEQVAQEALVQTGAAGVQVLVMDVNTGEILVMVDLPTFDLNEPPRSDIELLNRLVRNEVASTAQEPGMVFSAFSAAAALDAGIVAPDSALFCAGSYLVGGERIQCSPDGRAHGKLDIAQAMGLSCRAILADVATDMGRDILYEHLGRVGIGQRAGLPIRGESAGKVTAIKYITQYDVAHLGFGERIALTPVQITSAACAMVNGGNAMRPAIVSSIISADDTVQESFVPEVQRRFIAPAASSAMCDLLHRAVEEGLFTSVRIPGYKVGGLGSSMPKQDANGYAIDDAFISSFLGFAPMDEPDVAVYMFIDGPQGREDKGAVYAAPYARRVLQMALRHRGIHPSEEAEPLEEAVVPDVVGLSTGEAMRAMQESGLHAVVYGKDDAAVDSQAPATGAALRQGDTVILYTQMPEKSVAQEELKVMVPNIQGMGVVDANRQLRNLGLEMKFDGRGQAVLQWPTAGAWIDKGSAVQVQFEQVSRAPEGGGDDAAPDDDAQENG